MSRALVVDDSPTMRQMIGLALNRAGFEVTTAANGKEGLVSAAKPFELIITDINMPEMDGIAFIQGVRQLTLHKFTPVLVLTTEASGQRKDQGRVAGATGWLTKPFDPEKLLAVVRKVVR